MESQKNKKRTGQQQQHKYWKTQHDINLKVNTK